MFSFNIQEVYGLLRKFLPLLKPIRNRQISYVIKMWWPKYFSLTLKFRGLFLFSATGFHLLTLSYFEFF